MATSVLTPVCVTGPSEKSVAIADTSAPAPTEEGLVLASDVPEAAPAGCSCSVSRSSNSAVPDLNPSVSRVGDVVADGVEIGLHGVDAGRCGTEGSNAHELLLLAWFSVE